MGSACGTCVLKNIFFESQYKKNNFFKCYIYINMLPLGIFSYFSVHSHSHNHKKTQCTSLYLSVGRLVVRSANFQKNQTVTLSTFYWSTCFLIVYLCCILLLNSSKGSFNFLLRSRKWNREKRGRILITMV